MTNIRVKNIKLNIYMIKIAQQNKKIGETITPLKSSVLYINSENANLKIP